MVSKILSLYFGFGFWKLKNKKTKYDVEIIFKLGTIRKNNM